MSKLTEEERRELDHMPAFKQDPKLPRSARVAEHLANRGLLIAHKSPFISVPTYTWTRKTPKTLAKSS